MFSTDDSTFKQHILALMIVLLELLCIGVLFVATNNALYNITNHLNPDYPLYIQNVSDTLLTRFMAVFIFVRSWYYYATTDRIEDTYERNRTLTLKLKQICIHLVVFIVVCIISDFKILTRITSFISKILTH